MTNNLPWGNTEEYWGGDSGDFRKVRIAVSLLHWHTTWMRKPSRKPVRESESGDFGKANNIQAKDNFGPKSPILISSGLRYGSVDHSNAFPRDGRSLISGEITGAVHTRGNGMGREKTLPKKRLWKDGISMIPGWKAVQLIFRDHRFLSLTRWRNGYLYTHYYHHQQTSYLQPKQEQINENHWFQVGSRGPFCRTWNHRISFPFLKHNASSTMISLQKSQGWKGKSSILTS